MKKNLTTTLYKLNLLFLIGLISACGFQLRGTIAGVQSIHNIQLNLSEKISKEFEHDIIQELSSKNIAIDDSSEYTLKVTDTSSKKRRIATSVDAITDRYLMRFTINATLRKDSQRWPLNIYAERIFDDNTSTPNSKNREQDLINKELEQQALNLLSSRLYNFRQ